MSSDCVDLTFLLSPSNANTAQRTWSIRITQYDENHDNLAPFGCTQYFWEKDDAEGVLRSFNWNNGNGHHLADQDQVICIRREENMNRICYSTITNANDISISGIVVSQDKNRFEHFERPFFKLFCRNRNYCSVILWWLQI